MDYLLPKEEEDLKHEIELLYPRENLELAAYADDFKLHEFDHFLHTEENEIEMKSDFETMDSVLDSDDSPISFNYSDGSSSDEKCILETPPVSPPQGLTDLLQNFQFLPQPKPKKSTLKIDPNKTQFLTNIKGLKPSPSGTEVVLPKYILEKLMKFKEMETNKTSIKSINSQISLNLPLIAPTKSPQSKTVSRTPPAQKKSKIEAVSPPIAPAPFIIKDNNDMTFKNDVDMKALKRQQRMIKNRESACLSRKKKREHLNDLEKKVVDLESVIINLRTENELLRARIKEMESSYNGSGNKTYDRSKLMKKTTALLAVMFFCAFHFGTYSYSSGILTSELSSGKYAVAGPSLKHGRALLWAQPELQESEENVTSSLSRSTCPLHINQTESLRLEKELRRWIGIGDNFKNGTTFNKTKIEKKLLHNIVPSVQKFKFRKPNRWQKLGGGTRALDIYRPYFPRSLPRRDDTFYVFSFSTDHLLVPAVAHDITVRPKMSFLIPTVPFNESIASNGSVTMMQVDCEVLATKSIQVTEEDIRTFRPEQENVNKNNSTNATKELNYRHISIGRQKRRSEIGDSFDHYIKRMYRLPNGKYT